MQATDTDTAQATIGVPSPRRVLLTRVLIAAVAVAVAIGAVSYAISSDQPAEVVEPQVQQMSQDDITADLVRRGLIPAQTLEPAHQSREDLTQSLVNRGLIPGQTLEPASKSRQELTRDLVRQGLIPPQTLDD